MAVEAPKCRVCGHRHWMRDPHTWEDGTQSPATFAKGVVAKTPEKMPKNTGETPKNAEKVQTIAKKQADVSTIRQIGMRELSRSVSRNFSDLPFEITKNGKVIARVTKID